MTKDIENKCLKALESVMSGYYYSPYQFCIGGYSEEALCLTNEEGAWCITLFERGHKNLLSRHCNLLDACLDYINQNASNEDEQRDLKDQFVSNLFSNNTVATAHSVLKATV